MSSDKEYFANKRRALSKEPGTYALILRCSGQRSINIGSLGKLKLRKGYYIYVGSAFGPGGILSRIKHHCRISKSCHWHIDYLRPSTEIVGVWYSIDPEKREHQWTNILMEVERVELPFKGFGSSGCECYSHLLFFSKPITIKMFRTLIKQKIPHHHTIYSAERIASSSLKNRN